MMERLEFSFVGFQFFTAEVTFMANIRKSNKRDGIFFRWIVKRREENYGKV